MTTTTSRRAILAGAATLPALTMPSLASVPLPADGAIGLVPLGADKKLRRLWSKYIEQVAAHDVVDKKYRAARAAYDAEKPPCPEGVLPGHHWEAQGPLRRKHGCDALYDEWNAADDAIRKTITAVSRVKAESLFGIAVKLAAQPVDCESEDCVEAIAAALNDLDRLLGSDFASRFEERARKAVQS
jgi:hypothetical protein